MYLPQGNALEASVLASVSYGEVMIRFLDFPPVKAIQFALSVTLIIGYSNGTKLKVEYNFGPLSPLYLFQDETSLRHKLKYRHTKSVKDDDVEV